MAKKLNSKIVLAAGLAVTVIAGAVSVIRQKPPTADTQWELNDDGYEYVIRGVSNFGRGSTYYLYREKDGKREVVKVDVENSVNLEFFTDKPVIIAGEFVKAADGTDVVRIKNIRLKYQSPGERR